jgi:hypothetical protein
MTPAVARLTDAVVRVGNGRGFIVSRVSSHSGSTMHRYQTMDVAYVSALSALAGSVVGGLTSGFTTWLSQRAQARAGNLAHSLSRREDLYRDFIVAVSTAYGEAIISNEPQIQRLIALYAMISRMRTLSSPRIVACADKVMVTTIGTYFAPNRTIAELHELMKSGTALDPLKDFAEATREELQTFPLL